jgi:hypothetical protein
MTHPFAIKGKSGGNSGAWNEVHSGERVIYLIDGRTGILDECLHDGDAFVSWDDGTFETVRWYNLAPAAKVKIVGDRWEAILP